jgi:hypothetical protein
MADEKAKTSEVIKPRPGIEPREFALAAFYPQTQPAGLLRDITIAAPSVQPLQRGRGDDPRPPENVAKAWKKPWDR